MDTFGIWASRYPVRKRKQTVLPFKRVKSGFEMERNDCTVIALSQATMLSYQEAHDLLTRAGRKLRRGFHFVAWMESSGLQQIIGGCKFAKVYDWVDGRRYDSSSLIAGPRCGRELTLGQFIKSKPRGNYIVIVRSHTFAVVDGVIHDGFCKGQRTIIRKIYKVETD